jgi:aminoglycoside/choline kinase family phosphotransferase
MAHPDDDLLRRHAARALGREPSSAWPVTHLKGDASSRSYHRVAVGGGPSVVLMVMPPEPKSEEVTRGDAPAELPFVNVHRYLAGLGVRVTRILAYDTTAQIMVLEDLGDVTFEQGLGQGDPAARREALYGAAVDLLAKLRARADARPDPTCLASTRAFDEVLYRWEFDHFLEWGLTADRGISLQGAEKDRADDLANAMCRRLAALPRGFTHRDYQSRNLMLLPGDELVVIDFQDALQGPRQYDLVALLRDSYVELPVEFVERMVRRYLERLAAEGGPRIDPAPFLADFHLLTVQRKLKDAGRFVFIDRVKKNPSFLPYVRPSLGYVRAALERVPELAELREILGRHVPELA